MAAAYDEIADWYEQEFLGGKRPCGHVTPLASACPA